MLRTLLPFLILLFSTPVFAIYKCDINGNSTYSDTPCPAGKTVNLGNPPSQFEVAKAQQQFIHEKNTVKRLENERHKREAKEEKEQQQAARAYVRKQKKCASLALQKKWIDQDAATAAGKSAEKAKRKARRLTEKYQMECGV